MRRLPKTSIDIPSSKAGTFSSFLHAWVDSERLSCVLDELHEAVIHVQLLMAVQKRIAGIVGDEVHFDGVERHDVDDIFHQSAEEFIADARDFKRMTVQMNGVLIAAAVA